MHTRFAQDHAALLEIMQRFAVHLRDPAGCDAVLRHERVAFARIFVPHTAAEEQCVHALPPAPAGSARAAVIARFHTELRALRRDYSAHVNRWTPDAITADWRGYARAVLSLQKRLTDRMAWEEREIFPLIAGLRQLAA